MIHWPISQLVNIRNNLFFSCKPILKYIEVFVKQRLLYFENYDIRDIGLVLAKSGQILQYFRTGRTWFIAGKCQNTIGTTTNAKSRPFLVFRFWVSICLNSHFFLHSHETKNHLLKPCFNICNQIFSQKNS